MQQHRTNVYCTEDAVDAADAAAAADYCWHWRLQFDFLPLSPLLSLFPPLSLRKRMPPSILLLHRLTHSTHLAPFLSLSLSLSLSHSLALITWAKFSAAAVAAAAVWSCAKVRWQKIEVVATRVVAGCTGTNTCWWERSGERETKKGKRFLRFELYRTENALAPPHRSSTVLHKVVLQM